MVTAEMEKILNENDCNEEQSRFMDSLKKFNELVKIGVVKKRENQLIVDSSNVTYNINNF